MAISRFDFNYYLLSDDCLAVAISCQRDSHPCDLTYEVETLEKEEFLEWLNANEHQVDFFTKDEAERILNLHTVDCSCECMCLASEHLLSPFHDLDDCGASYSCLVCKEDNIISFYGVSFRYHVRYDEMFAHGQSGKIFIKMKDRNKITF